MFSDPAQIFGVNKKWNISVISHNVEEEYHKPNILMFFSGITTAA